MRGRSSAQRGAAGCRRGQHRQRPCLPLLCALLALALLGAAGESRLREVRPGDTLSRIALELLGDPLLWPAIYEANRDQIKDPSRIYPGQRLTIPEIPPEELEAVRREAREHSSR